MKCEKMMYLMVLYLNREISETDKPLFESHLATCEACRQEMAHMQGIYQQLRETPVIEPDAVKMRLDFNDMLDEYKQVTVETHTNWLNRWREKLAEVWQPVYTMQLAMGLLLLLMGWAGGYWFSPDRTNTQQLSQLTQEVQQMRETMLLNMLEKPAATDRLKAVNFTRNLDTVDEKVIQALLQTLNNDPNVNVRLVTVETLHQLASYPMVREGLILSITRQESPMVQIALADVMVQLQEKRSIKALQNLLRQKDLNASVKHKLRQSVKVLS